MPVINPLQALVHPQTQLNYPAWIVNTQPLLLSTVVPLITRSIGSGGDLAIKIPRYRMHYGYGKAVMRPVEYSPRCRVIPLSEKLVIGCSVATCLNLGANVGKNKQIKITAS